MTLTEYASKISRFKKERFLRNMTEDAFRDQVVRPLFLLRGMQDGRDLCGPAEAGKDSIFTTENKLGQLDIYALQTKRGNINLSRINTENVVTASTQLKTALETSVTLLKPRGKFLPNRAILCASGKINDSARNFITDRLGNPNISFLDSDELIPDIDKLMPELWFDIDSNVFPYIRRLKSSIEKGTQLFSRGELISANLRPIVISEEAFVSLRTYRFIFKRKKVKGNIEQIPELIEFPITSLVSAKDNLVLLLGGAGAGKSTSLLRMVYLLCERFESSDTRVPIPVFFRANELTSPGECVLDAILTRTQEIGDLKISPISTDDLRHGYISLFIDALDELPNKDVQQAVVTRLVEFANAYPKCRIILASRPYYNVKDIPALAHFVEHRIATMSYREGQKILERLNKSESLPVVKSSELLRQLQDVHGLELNPLIITVFAASCDGSRCDVPANITELFKKFTEQMLGRWDETKGLSSQYQAPLKDFILTRVAFEIHTRRVTSVPVAEFEALIESELSKRGHRANTAQLTDEIVKRSGLFRINDGSIEFRHLMLQEFFAGRGIPSDHDLKSIITDEWWRRSIVFYFGDRPNEPHSLRKISNGMELIESKAGVTLATTIGLAVQASYLVEIKDKLPLAEAIIKRLAIVSNQFDKSVIQTSTRPLERFIDLIISAREAVAFSFLNEHFAEIKNSVQTTESTEREIMHLRHFWLIIGLIESGALERAIAEIDSFHPADRRLYLGLHLGAYLMHRQRVVTQNERQAAATICSKLQDKIHDLRKQILDELKSDLLEIQKGRLTALEDGQKG